MSLGSQPRGTLFAVALIVAGAILFFDNIGILPINNIGAYWPMAFVVYGAGLIVRKTNSFSIIWSSTLILFGTLLTLGNLGIIRANFAVAWPLLLIAVGVTALVHRSWWASKLPEARNYGDWRNELHATKHQWRQWKREHRRQQWQNHNWDPNGMHESAVFFSLSRRFDGKEIRDGDLSAVFGSIEADFTGATIPLTAPEDGGPPVRRVVIDASAVFGSVEIRVPQNWRVIKEGSGVFGSYDDRTLPFRPEPGVEPPTLVIRGGAVFGSVTIEN